MDNMDKKKVREEIITLWQSWMKGTVILSEEDPEPVSEIPESLFVKTIGDLTISLFRTCVYVAEGGQMFRFKIKAIPV